MNALSIFSTSWITKLITKLVDTTLFNSKTKTRFQSKVASGTFTSTQTPMVFNNLTVGKFYRISVNCEFNNDNNEDSSMSVYNGDGSRILRVGNSQTLTGTINLLVGASMPFIYVGPSPITLVKESPNGTLQVIRAILEELPNHEATTDWT